MIFQTGIYHIFVAKNGKRLGDAIFSILIFPFSFAS